MSSLECHWEIYSSTLRENLGDARLVPGKGQSQDLILKNKGSSPQKRCTVHWSIIP